MTKGCITRICPPVFTPQGCRRHRPEGCCQYWRDMAAESGAPAEGRSGDCPSACLTLPVLTLLRKISNHLDLVRVHDRQWYEKVWTSPLCIPDRGWLTVV